MIKIPIAKPFLGVEEQLNVIDALQSGWISQGPKCAEFEKALADYVGVRYGRCVNSGTSALHLSLLACGIQPGDEVIVPAFTCVATLNPIEYVGAKPVLVDIELPSYGMDIKQLEKVITPQTKAVIVVHLFGLAARVNEVINILESYQLNINVIEDAALGLGAKIGKQYVGSFGDISCLSFHPRKMITTGEGGMVLTNSEKIATRVSELRNYGASKPAWERHTGNLYDIPNYERVGYNYKLTDIQAGIGLEQVKKLEKIIQLRRCIAKRYNENLADLTWLDLPNETEGLTHVYQSYICLLQTKDRHDIESLNGLRRRFWQHLAEWGIASVQGAQSMATIAFYRQRYDWEPIDFPSSLIADQGSVALPIYPGLTQDDQDYIIKSVRAFKSE